jgi:HEAT repeat protein
LTVALHSPDGDVRRAASRSLGQLGKAALPVIDNAKALEDVDPEARRLTVESLRLIGAEVVAPLTAALSDNSAAVRRAAARALGSFGSGARTALSALEGAASDPAEDVRSAAAKALREIRTE